MTKKRQRIFRTALLDVAPVAGRWFAPMLRHLRSDIAAWLAAAGWAVAIFIVSSIPGPGGGSTSQIVRYDNIAHFFIYAAGGFLLVRALKRSRPRWRPAALFVLATGALWIYGLSDEFHQSFVPKRNGMSTSDLVADALGALTGVYFYLKLRRGPHPAQRPD